MPVPSGTTTIAPATRPARVGACDERFAFHPRATNPELWRTTLPLVVYERCGGHKGLIATWMAIHWLIVLHAAAGRRDFGVREIAARACVGRNELTGPRGYIQRLVDLGLLQIVGHDDHGGQFRAPRPVYHLDLWELERLSLELIPDVLRAQNVAPPPRPAPDPRQTSFLDALGEAPGLGQPAVVPGPPAPWPAQILPTHANVTGVPGSQALSHANGTACHTDSHTVPWNGTGMHGNGTGPQASGPAMPECGTGAHENVTVSPDTVPGAAQNRDVERGKDREIERVSDDARTLMIIQELSAQVVQVALQSLQLQGVQLTVPQPDTPPAPPADQPQLPETLETLWKGDHEAIAARDRHQLRMLAAEMDAPTDGYGAYWVGRAILIADRCLAERGQALNINYLRGMLRRWQREGSWGSDLEGEPGEAATHPRGQGGAASTAGARRSGAAPAPAPDLPLDHPAVRAYVEALHETPNAVQAAQVVATVTDLDAWRQVLRDWQLNGWGERSVGKMLDRYQKAKAASAPPEPPPSVGVIHHYPGLTMDQREQWIRRFHRAETPAEKRAVLARLEQEHPR